MRPRIRIAEENYEQQEESDGHDGPEEPKKPTVPLTKKIHKTMKDGTKKHSTTQSKH